MFYLIKNLYYKQLSLIISYKWKILYQGSREPIAAGKNSFTFNSPDATLKIRLIEKMEIEPKWVLKKIGFTPTLSRLDMF